MKNNDFHSHVTRQSNNINLCFVRTGIKTRIVLIPTYRTVAFIQCTAPKSNAQFQTNYYKFLLGFCLLRNSYSCLMNNINS